MNHFAETDWWTFFPPQFLGITPLLKLANLTDDQLAGKTHPHADTHVLTELIQPEHRRRYLHQNWSYRLLSASLFSLVSHAIKQMNAHTYTHVHFPPHDKHAA